MPPIVIRKGALKSLAQKSAAAVESSAGASGAGSVSPIRIKLPSRRGGAAAHEPRHAQHGVKKSVLDAALDRAIQAEKIKDYFISSVGRDLRRGLDSIAEIAQWLRDGTEDERAYVQALDSLMAYSAELKLLLDDLVSVAQLDPNDQDSGKEPTDCAAQISTMAENFRAEALAKGVSLAVRTSPMPMLEIDAHRLRQLVKLLVENAVKFTTEGRIGVQATFFAGKLKLVVEDTGCGLPPEVQREFATLDVRRDMSGETGMALSVIKRLAFSLGGDVSLRSTPGIGTVITVTIASLKVAPGYRESSLSTMQCLTSLSRRIGSRMSRGAKVLVVDDSAVNLTVVTGLLKGMGFSDIALAHNGSEALAKLLTEPYDLLLTDVHMPEMDGRTLVREIRKIPAYAKMLVYAVTVDDVTKDNFREIGFTDVILKPVTMEKLQDILG